MTKFTLTLSVLIAMTIKTTAQIPNSGFENWTTVGSYENPTGWASTNSSSTGSFYAVTKSTDHYPVTVGAYSVRIENNTSLVSTSRGIIMTGTLGATGAAFPITGHPTSLTGYHKFAPLNGDTMFIQIHLFKNGSYVSSGEFASTASASNWTSFNIPLPAYTTADSGWIIIAAYYANGSNYVPHGNSVLYIDNLNFDNLITSVPLSSSEFPSKFNLAQNYPNPFNPATSISFGLPSKSFVLLKVFDLIGREVATIVSGELSAGTHTREWNAANMPSGIYFYRLQAGSFSETKKLVLMR